MKRIVFLIGFITLGFSVLANGVWTVGTIPNTRLESNDIHVSDPDGYLSDSAEMNINTALCAIRDKADVFIVTLSSIGDADPKRFATQLFNSWGIGDAETNNGVLLLFVEDQHALEFETGYGAEETLTDAKCAKIFNNTIVPFFRAGDYEGGLCAGVGEIVGVYGGEIPLGLKTTLPSLDDEGHGDSNNDISAILLLFALLMVVMPIVGFVYWLYKRNNRKSAVTDTYHSFEEGGATYIDSFNAAWSGSPWEGKGCLGGLMLGFSLFVILIPVILFMNHICPDMEENRLFDLISVVTLVLYLTWICFRHNQRALKMADKLAKQSLRPSEVYKAAYNNTGTKIATWIAPWLGWIYRLIFKKRMAQSNDFQCPICHAELKKDGAFTLPEVHALENRLGALKFTPFRCANGHEVVLKGHGSRYTKFQACPKCGAFTSMLTKTEILREANYSQSGERENTYVCQHCGDTITKIVAIPMLYHYSGGSSYSSGSSRSSSSRSYSSHSSSHSSRGSFGGGRSGGGGHSGRW